MSFWNRQHRRSLALKRSGRALGYEPLETRLALTALVANGDFFAGQQDQPLVIDTARLLTNDTAANRESLSVALSLSRGPTHGTLTIGDDGNLLYQPEPGFYGLDYFSYHAQEGDQFSVGAASVTIDIKKYVPPASGGFGGSYGIIGWNAFPPGSLDVIFIGSPYARDDRYEIAEDNPLVVAAPGVLGNDYSGDSSKPLEAELATPPAHGTVTLNPDGGFSYLPAQDYFGNDQYTYRWTNASGATLSATVYITITPVNDAPVATDDAFTSESGRSLSIAIRELLANDRDVDNTVVHPLLPLNAKPQYGTLTLSSAGLLYTPELGYQGPDQFSYFDTDGELFSQRATVSLELTAPLRHNRRQQTDVNTDDHVSPLDALLIVNFLNAHRSQPVASAARLNRDLLDVNGDGFVAASDCLDVINELNARREGAAQASESQGEGEAAVVDGLTQDILALDLAHTFSGNSRRSR